MSDHEPRYVTDDENLLILEASQLESERETDFWEAFSPNGEDEFLDWVTSDEAHGLKIIFYEARGWPLPTGYLPDIRLDSLED